MNSPDQHGFRRGDSTQDRDLDSLLRWGVEELAGTSEPSSRVWQRIEQQLRAGQPPKRQSLRVSSWRSTSAAQALALASLLLVVGLSVGPMLQWPSYVNDSGKPVETLTRTPKAAPSGDMGDDSLPILADEGMLNRRQVMLWEQEQAHERQAIANATSPALDPILTHRRLARASD
jgi:hypothetical protein